MDAALRRAVGTTLMPGFAGPALPDWLTDELGRGLGGVCLFGTNVETPEQVRGLTDAIHAANPDAVVCVDEEGGDVTRLHHAEGSPYPSMALLGRIDDELLTERVGRGIGAELRAAGVDLDLAPVADVNSNPRNPVIGVRSFGADAALVGRHVAAYTRGLQSAGVGAVAKHFPGHGDTAADSHLALPTIAVDAAELAARDLPPFEAAVAAGTLAVMTSHLMVPALDAELPATFSGRILGLLRERGFTGAIVSDALDMAGASGGRGIPEAAVLALAAGVDLLCIGSDNSPDELAAIREHVLAAVAAGRLSAERVHEAAGRVRALAREVGRLRSGPAGPLEEPPRPDPEWLWHRRPFGPVVAPVLLRLASPANIAAGEVVWGLGEHLRAELDAALPGATCVDVQHPTRAASALAPYPGRPIVVQGRDLARVGSLREGVRQVRAQRPDAIVVDLGWPEFAGPPRLDVATFGAGRASALALIALLAEGSR